MSELGTWHLLFYFIMMLFFGLVWTFGRFWVARISPRTRYPLWGTGVQIICDHGKRPLSKESAVRILEGIEQRSERFLKLRQYAHTTLQFIAYAIHCISCNFVVDLLLAVIWHPYVTYLRGRPIIG